LYVPEVEGGLSPSMGMGGGGGRLMIKDLKRTTDLNSVTSKKKLQEWTGKMKVSNKNTSTSPSSKHLGHHKAIIKPFPMSEHYDQEKTYEPPSSKI
jgi:hypothetical protein